MQFSAPECSKDGAAGCFFNAAINALQSMETRDSRFKIQQIPSSFHALHTRSKKLWGHDSHDGLVLQNDSRVVVADVAKGVPMAAYLQTVGRGP